MIINSTLRRIIPDLRNQSKFSGFHSTSVSLAKWKSKSDCKDDEPSYKKPSKSKIRYAVRQKRADMKKALRDFLLYGKTSKLYSQDEGLGYHVDKSTGRNRVKSKSNGSSFSGKQGGNKRRKNKYTFAYEDDDDDYEPQDTNFRASYAGHKGFTWNSSSGFEWKDQSKWEKTRKTVGNGSDADEDVTDRVSHTHRRTLGLSSTGPLTLDDVKCAFRASALKWHPDKHQGASQALAGEKFKLCLDAYNALRETLQSP